MEGKTVILSVLLLSLFMSQIQVEAVSCCPNPIARHVDNDCRRTGRFSNSQCADFSGCKIVDEECPKGYAEDILENSGDVINKYCKLGCASSVCGAMTALQNSDASKVVNGAVEQCTKACSAFCTKGSITALETSA